MDFDIRECREVDADNRNRLLKFGRADTHHKITLNEDTIEICARGERLDPGVLSLKESG